jgi:parallel beta-helix repeat protein
MLFLSPGCYEVQAYPEDFSVDYQISGRKYVSLTPDELRSSIDFALEPGGHDLIINVTSGGSPVDGAQVGYRHEANEVYQQGITEANGQYTFYNVPAGTVNVWARDDASGRAFNGKDVDISASTTTVNLELVAESCITGKVIDENSGDMSSVWVNFYSELHNNGAGALTDATGNFTICTLPGGIHGDSPHAIGELEVEPGFASGYCQAADRKIFVQQGTTTNVGIIQLQRCAIVEGRMIGSHPDDLCGLELESDGSDFEADGEVIGDTYQLRLPEGIHRINLDAPGWVPYQVVAESAEVPPVTADDVTSGTPVSAPDMTVYSNHHPDSAQILGSIGSNGTGVDPSGEFVVGVFPAGVIDTITMQSLAGTQPVQEMLVSGFDSQFTLSPVPPGTWDVYWILNNRTEEGLESFTVRGLYEDVILDAGGASSEIPEFAYNAVGSPVVSGVVEDSNQNPILGARVLIINDVTGMLAGFAETDETGYWAVYNLLAGDYTFTAGHHGFDENTTATLQVENGTSFNVGTISLTPYDPPNEPTDVSGNISSNTNWTPAGSPYIVTGNVIVDSGVTLTIAPGVVVKFEQNARLTIYGTLVADGTPTEQIYFTSLKDDVGGDTNGDGDTSSPARNDWDWLDFTTDSLNSVLDNVVVRYGGSYNNGAVNIATDLITFENNLIEQNSHHGIRIDNVTATPNLSISDNTISNNGWSGIFVSNSSVTINNNIISNNGREGIDLNNSTATITNNTISGNDWDGIDVSNTTALTTIANNTISQNDGYGIVAVNSTLESGRRLPGQLDVQQQYADGQRT